MDHQKLSHDESGGRRVLAIPWVYGLFVKMIAKSETRARLVHEFMKPFPGCRILDIGCGTGNIVPELPDSIAEYVGFDMNPAYIEAAKKLWKAKRHCSFFCEKVRDATVAQKSHYDIVLALGIIHHLDDAEALRLIKISQDVLKPGGVLVTWDPVYVENQNPLAKWLISNDRGKAVRTEEHYKLLARPSFPEIAGYVLHDTLRVPYTIFSMKCTRAAAATTFAGQKQTFAGQ